MAATAEPSTAAHDRLSREEERLARAAAAGDGAAFAELYERYESRAYNLAYRVTGSADNAADATQDAFVSVLRRLPQIGDRDELNFGSYLLTSTRNACYDLMRKHQNTHPTDDIPETARPVGSSAGGLLDPGDPGADPDRNVLVQAQQAEIREANFRLPDRQREALALVELEGMSYDQVGEAMDMNRNAVAQLISRARIKLRDELRGTALASIAATSPECERALPLIALDDDRQLDPASEDSIWLGGHVAECNSCRLSREAMEEAGRSYRAWIPVAAAPLLFRETMAEAAEAIGADWSDVIAEGEAARAANAGPSASGPGNAAGAKAVVAGATRRISRPSISLPSIPRPNVSRPNISRPAIPRPSRRVMLVTGGIAAALLLIGGFALAGGDSEPDDESLTPAADVATTPFPAAKAAPKAAKPKKAAAKKSSGDTQTTPGPVTPAPPAGGGPANPGTGGGNTGGGGGSQPEAVAPTPDPTPAPTPPAAEPPPQVEEPPPVVNEPPTAPPSTPGRVP